MIDVDQPIGVGFSYGTDKVTSTLNAAPYVWNLLQAFYGQFPQYENHNFGLFTESYGGHYGPEFASYFESQNSAIKSGSVSGTNVPLVALGINNGWIDPIIHYRSYVDYAYNNSYNQIIDSSQHSSFLNTYTNKCLPALQQCTATSGQTSACQNSESICQQDIEGPINGEKDFDTYDVREPSNDPYPPETYSTYLQSAQVTKAIGAQATYTECPSAPYNKFESTGDNSRSFMGVLSNVVQSGIRVLIWAGDADFICNYQGSFNVVNALNWANTKTFASTALKSYTVNGAAGGLFKTMSNLNYLQVYAAGHEVPYYQPAVALQVFKQIMGGNGLAST